MSNQLLQYTPLSVLIVSAVNTFEHYDESMKNSNQLYQRSSYIMHEVVKLTEPCKQWLSPTDGKWEGFRKSSRALTNYPVAYVIGKIMQVRVDLPYHLGGYGRRLDSNT